MEALSFKTAPAKPQSVERNWHIIDAENQIVGRLASQIAILIRGKHKPLFSPHVDCGDKVIVINADKIRFTGKKMQDKQYIHHTGYPGGQRINTPTGLLAKKPTEILAKAVTNMLPHSRLRKEYLKNLFLYQGAEHPHQAQQPKTVKVSMQGVRSMEPAAAK